jgi:hexosaminidase
MFRVYFIFGFLKMNDRQLLVKMSPPISLSIIRKKFILTCVSLFLALWANNAGATVSYYWDINGTTSGAGGGASPSGSWEGTNWSTSSTGTKTTGNWVEGSFPRFCAGTSATGVYTVTANANHTLTGVYNTTPGTTIITGSGTLYLPYTNDVPNAYNNGFLVSDVLIISNVMADFGGSASIETEVTGGAQLYFYGANTYSGGTLLGNLSGTSGGVNFGNNSAFGTGLIQMSASGGTLAAVGSGPYTIANAVNMANVTLTLVGTPAGVNFSGPWDTGSTGPCTLALSGAGNIVNISGVISDSEGFVKSGVGTLVLSGSNTYGTAGAPGGNTQVSGGLLVLANTNGSATGVSGIVVASAATLTGNGAITGTVDDSGIISATNLPGGTATLTTGSQTWEQGSIYQWAINNATGTAGAASGWDQILINGGMTINASSASPLNINIISLTAANQPGALAAFNNAQDYSWLAIHSTNPPIAGFSTSVVTVNGASFGNALGTGAFSVTTNNTPTGGDLFVNFVHAPILTLSNLIVSAGSNAVFSAVNTVSNSTSATAVYSWKSNNVFLSDGGRISGSATSSLTISNVQPTDAATYTVFASNVAGLYFLPATLTVIAASTAVTWTNPVPIIYGTALSSNQLNATANVPGTFAYNPPAGAVLNSGSNTLSVIFTPTDPGTYSSATNTVGLVVSNAPLTVTADSFSRPHGATNPVFTGTIIGLQNGDNITATYSCSANSSSPLGTYPIVPSLVDPNNRQTNYVVSLINGTLAVGSLITWPTPSPILYGTALGSNQLNATANVPGTFVYTPASGTLFNSGTYQLSVVFTPTDTVDYNTSTGSVSLVVSPEPLTVTAANVTRQAGTTNPVFTGTISGLVNGDNITATYSSSANSASAAGTYSIVPALVDPNNLHTNYAVNLVNGVLTVTPPPPPITVNAPSIIPLPVVLSNRPGIFALCPSQPAAPVPAHALMQILVDGASQQTGQFLAAALFKSTGYQFQLVTSSAANAVKGAILITTANAISTLGAEGYELTVAPDSVVIRAPAQGGAFYGVQSLLQLLPPQIYSPTIVTNVPWVAPCVYIQDYPLYSWRGTMLDVARHFFNKQEVKQLVDAMAMHKLNTLHLHLTDDQGWRLEITNYPNLTANGAWRNGIDYGLAPRATTATNAAGQYGGFYTQADARELVAYAQERHITVVPEIEMPAHSDAGLDSYGKFSCGDSGDYTMDYYGIQSLYDIDLWSLGTPGTMDFLKDVLAETMSIFPGKYIHCGGDEAVAVSGSSLVYFDSQWLNYNADVTNMEANGISPNNGVNSVVAYQHWFSTTIANFIKSNGHVMLGWSETEFGGVVPNAGVMDWIVGSFSQAVPVAEAGLPVVMSPDNNCYVNYVEGSSSSLKYEPGFAVGGAPSYLTVNGVYSYNPMPAALPAAYASNILGAQCNLWCEYVPSFENAMFKLFPRESAMAEITWTPTNLQNYASFTNRLSMQKQRFAQMGVNYDHEVLPQIGTWGPTVPTTGVTNFYDITTNVTAAGEIDVSFWYGTGTNLSITSASLLVNGVPVDIDTHAGLAESISSYQSKVEPFIPVFTLYVLHLPETVPGATYKIQAVMAGSGGSTTSGTVYLANWN